MRAPLKQLRKACVEQSGVDEKDIAATRDGNVPDVPELKCYILCLFEHAGVIESDDSIDFTIVYHLMPPEHRMTVEYVSKTCGTKRMTFVLIIVVYTFVLHLLHFNNFFFELAIFQVDQQDVKQHG